MNSVPNSDSEQCTELKLGWVHQVHTLTQPTHAQAVPIALRPSVSRSCCGPMPDRIVTYGRSCRRLGIPCRSLYRDTPSTKTMRARRVACCSACRSTPAPYRGALWPCRRAVSLAVSQPCCTSYHDTMNCIATHSTSQAARPFAQPAV